MASNKGVAVAAHLFSSPVDGIKIVERDIPTPGQGQVLVRLKLRPVDPADVFSLLGVYPGFPSEVDGPAGNPVLGLEGMGEVVSLGPGTSGKLAVGQRVAGFPFSGVASGQGTWQQYVAADEASLSAVPDGVPDEAAAQAWINPVPIVGMLREIGAPKGGYILQTGAGSVLGRMLIAYARKQGLHTVNVVRRQGLVEELKPLLGPGDAVVVNESGEGLKEAVLAATGGHLVHGAVEAVGGDLFAAAASCVRDGGLAIIYGAMSGLTASFGIPDPLFRGVRIHGFWLVPWFEALSEPERQAVIAEVWEGMADGTLSPYTGKRFPLDDAANAVAESKRPARGGKVLLEG